jgi:23S rRNA-intervening sequence protein
MLAHEKLHAYGKSLAFAAAASVFMADWENKHAITDQLGRATDSLVLNLAEGARLQSGARKLRSTSIVLNIAEANGRYSELDHRRFLDMAEGSAAKTTACLDLAVQKRRLIQADSGSGKVLLERIVAMLSRM